MKRWTNQELERLRECLDFRGDPCSELGRSQASVKYGIKLLGSGKRRREWGDKDDEKMRQLWVADDCGKYPSDPQLAKQMGWSTSTVKNHRLHLGLIRQGWSKAEERYVESMWRAGKNDTEICAAMKIKWPDAPPKTPGKISRRRCDLGLVRGHRGVSVRDYATLTLVRELRRRGDLPELLKHMKFSDLAAECDRRGVWPAKRT
jgi:hypothetical protein